MEAIIELNENITKLYVIILCFKGKKHFAKVLLRIG